MLKIKAGADFDQADVQLNQAVALYDRLKEQPAYHEGVMANLNYGLYGLFILHMRRSEYEAACKVATQWLQGEYELYDANPNAHNTAHLTLCIEHMHDCLIACGRPEEAEAFSGGIAHWLDASRF